MEDFGTSNLPYNLIDQIIGEDNISMDINIEEDISKMDDIETIKLPPDVIKYFCQEDLSEYEDRDDIFLTGAGGTGKSYFINHIIRQDTSKTTVFLSSTGISSIPIGGMTIHRFFKIGIINNVEDLIKSDEAFKAKDEAFYFRTMNVIKRQLDSVNQIVIDEVSMVSYGLLDCVIYRLHQAKMFDKVRIIFSGDILQLPQVEGVSILKHPLFIQAKIIHLTKIHRTSNIEFANQLSRIRKGDVDVSYINRFVIEEMLEDTSYSFLFSTNKEAAYKNRWEYDKLKGEEVEYVVKVEPGTKTPSAQELKSALENLRVTESIKFKIGTRVLYTINSSNGLVNGDVGEIISVAPNSVMIKFDRFDEPFEVSNNTWSKEVLLDDEITTEYIIDYMPLVYAWGITIHKSQGMSIDKLHIDVRHIFAPSQFYVAISRATNPETVKLFAGGGDVGRFLHILKRVNLDGLHFYEALEKQTTKRIKEDG